MEESAFFSKNWQTENNILGFLMAGETGVYRKLHRRRTLAEKHLHAEVSEVPRVDRSTKLF